MASQDALKTQGNDAFKNKRYDEAIQHYTKAIAVDPNCEACSAIYSNRAASFQALGRFAEALKDSEDCVRVKPNWLKGHYRRGIALESLGRLDEAVRAFEDALKTEPANEEVQERLSATRDRIKARNESMKPQQCQTAEEAKTIGNSLFGVGRYDIAAEFYGRAIALTPGDSEEKANYYSNRAACRQQIHDYKGVIDDANQALNINPNHVKALLRRAIAHEGLEKWKQAFEDYNKVNMLSPGMSNVSQGVVRCQRALRS
jgi:tetratricopeptide (TPR) repeat protein